MKKKLLIVPVIIIIFIIVWLFYPTEERRMKNDIKNLKNAVENKSIAIVGTYLDIQYRDNNDLTREQLIETMGRFFAQVDSVNVQMKGLKVWIDSTAADNTIFGRCSLGVRVLARYEGERVLAFGGVIKPSTVRAWLKKTAGNYRVYSAEY